VTTPRLETSTDSEQFPVVRKGYQCEVVDRYTRRTRTELEQLKRRCEALVTQNRELLESKEQMGQQPGDFAGLGHRAQEILRMAEEQAREVTRRAAREADQLTEETQMELDRRRETTTRELDELRQARLAELEALRAQSEKDAADVAERTRTESEQLLAAARLAAESVRAEAEASARGLIEAATLEADALKAAAEKDAGRIRQQLAEKRSRSLSELQAAQQEANKTTAATLAEATEKQRLASEHLVAETEKAAQLRQTSHAEAEKVKLEAIAEAEQIIVRAQQAAATIDERARQEFAWRRRQMRHEQELLSRRKQAMLNQLTSLSALAAETAEKLPEVPDLDLHDLPDFSEELLVAEPPAPETETQPEVSDRQLAHASPS
jgi:hypothetical protein